MAEARTIGRKDFTYQQTVGRELPLGSGFGANFNDDPICRENLRKSHTLGTRDVQHPEANEDPSVTAPEASYDMRMTMVTASQSYGAGATGKHLTAREKLSTWEAQRPALPDESVLRFLGYYMEQIPESPDERVRVHKVALLFHVADGTVALREANQVNSGLPQGLILQRQAVAKADGSGNVGMADLSLGATINIYGKHVTLVDCSAATREYLAARNMDVGNTRPWPAEDTYNQTAQTKLQTRPKRTLPTSDFDHKRALEAMRGSGIISKHAPDDVRTAQQFLCNRINEHLQFAAYWDDRDKKSGDLRLAVVKYYLENDTIEIVERRPENAGREGGAKLLCRQRVLHPKAPVPPPGAVQQNTFGLLVKTQYVTFDDLTVGQEIPIAGRTYFLYDADKFTRQWYADNRGVELPPAVDISAVVQKGVRPQAVHYPPPHNGFGSEEDSLRNCKTLMLKQPRQDTRKLQEEGGKVLIFKAKLHNVHEPEDVAREFVLAFHCATDEIEITERQLRNSGIVGGKFLAKGRHLRALPDGRKVPFQKADFGVGAVVTVAGRSFKLEVIDERSKRILEGHVDEVTEDRLKQLVVEFRELLNAKYYRAHEAYRALAPEGTLSAPQLIEFFDKSCATLTEEEANHLVFHFSDADAPGRIGYDRFRRIMDPGNTTNLDEAANKPQSVKGLRVFDRASDEGRAHDETLRAQCDKAADQAAARRIHRTFADKLLQRRGTVQEAFRMIAGHAPSARLSRASLISSLETVLRMTLSAREIGLLCRAMFPTEESERRGLDFREFCEFVEAV